jgi:hypothetical protein
MGGGYDRALSNLLEATRDTALRGFNPFTSMNRLCFARSSWPFQDIQPALIEFRPEGTFVVRSEGPYPGHHDGPIALETSDPGAAVAAAIRVLAI